MNKPKTKIVGEIDLGKTVLITDPCYSRGTWCAGSIDNVLPGKFVARMTYSDQNDWGERVSSISVTRQDSKVVKTIDSGIDVGVDSGTCGIFDDSIYPPDVSNEDGTPNDDEDSPERKKFYEDCGELTLPKYDYSGLRIGEPAKIIEPYHQGGVLYGKGIVSSSGFGDGSYQCILGLDDQNNVVYIRINFINFVNFK